MLAKDIEILGRKVSSTQPCFIIAEAGVNHNGSLEMAFRLVDVAVEAGADAIKFQTFKADRLVTRHAPKADYQRQNTGTDEPQYEMLKRLELSEHAHYELMCYCQQQKILFISTPFDEESADFLSELGVAVFKLPSGEVTNLPFLSYVAAKGKPLLLSTGMSYLSEVELAVRTIKASGDPGLLLLHCVSNYPAKPEEVNLQAMRTMAIAFGLPIGYSDHTLGIEVALAAVALGACVVEKHITLDRALPGPDHQASLEPQELIQLVQGIRMVQVALGNGIKQPTPSEANTAAIARKSLVAAQEIVAGSVLTEEMIAIKRPGTGLLPALRSDLVGRMVRVNIPAGTLLQWEMLA